jgi:hypothetical protein
MRWQFLPGAEGTQDREDSLSLTCIGRDRARRLSRSNAAGFPTRTSAFSGAVRLERRSRFHTKRTPLFRLRRNLRPGRPARTARRGEWSVGRY